MTTTITPVDTSGYATWEVPAGVEVACDLCGFRYCEYEEVFVKPREDGSRHVVCAERGECEEDRRKVA